MYLKEMFSIYRQFIDFKNNYTYELKYKDFFLNIGIKGC